jgi:hypothetical protein
MGQFIYSDPRTMTFVYTATGGEGNPAVIPLPSLIGKTINLVTYNTLTLIPEPKPPDSQGWYYDSTVGSPTYGDLLLGIPLNPNDVIQIVFT